MYEENKDNRFINRKKKEKGPHKDLFEDNIEKRAKKRDFKKKKQQIQDEESWENWREYYK